MTRPDDAARVAVVTGAAGGLGPACCEVLLRSGFDVVAADLNAEGVAQAAADLGGHGRQVTGVGLDVTDRAAVEALVAGLDRVDVLVNLAGVIRRATLAKITEEDFRLTIATHVEGTLSVMRAVAPGMRSRGYGRIVNTSSIAIRGSIAGGSYAAAKGAIEGLTHSVALELAPHGITVNCVAPGLVDAGIFLTTPEEFREQLTNRVPMRRLAEASEIAACIAFLASPQASYVTGQTLTVCGGLSLGF